MACRLTEFYVWSKRPWLVFQPGHHLISRIKRWQVFRSFFQVETPFELKLNVTDTELVVVENAAMWDTNAIILKVMLIPVGFHH